jgi:hypothetical protein
MIIITIAAMLAIAAWPSLLFQKRVLAGSSLIIAGLQSGMRGLAGYFATGVPNLGNGGIPRFLALEVALRLASIAKHW